MSKYLCDHELDVIEDQLDTVGFPLPTRTVTYNSHYVQAANGLLVAKTFNEKREKAATLISWALNALPVLIAMARELILIQAVHADCEGGRQVYADGYNEMRVERDALLETNKQCVVELEAAKEAWHEEHELVSRLLAERDRYLAALKTEACEKYWDATDHSLNPGTAYFVGGIEFGVGRNAAGELVAEEVNE